MFNKSMIAALLTAVAINAFLCHSRNQLQAENSTFRQEVALVRADNQNLANQIELAQAHAEQYRQQVSQLHNQVLTKLNQAESRTNALINELEKHQNWAIQSIPAGVGRLLQRNNTVSHGQTDPDSLPTQPTMPNAKPNTSH